jgi:hypothetical protein
MAHMPVPCLPISLLSMIVCYEVSAHSSDIKHILNIVLNRSQI